MCCKREPWTEYSVWKKMYIQHLQIDHETKTKKRLHKRILNFCDHIFIFHSVSMILINGISRAYFIFLCCKILQLMIFIVFLYILKKILLNKMTVALFALSFCCNMEMVTEKKNWSQKKLKSLDIQYFEKVDITNPHSLLCWHCFVC